MNIDKKTSVEIQRYIKLARSSNTYELECAIKGINDKKTVDNITWYLMNNGFKYEVNQELDITYDKNLRTTIRNDGNNVTEYCKSNLLPISSNTIQKQTIQGVPVLKLDEYDVVFKMKNEVVVNTDIEKHDVAKSKLFRFKKRFSFIHPGKPYLRMDITAVKSKSSHTMISSGVLDEPQRYEVELELIQENIPAKATLDTVFASMVDIISKIIMIRQQSFNLITKSESATVIEEYIKLTKGNSRFRVDMDMINKNPKSWFIGPQPVTLEQQNMVQNNVVDRFTIYENYTVTDKADGERVMLYIPKNVDNRRTMYLINSKMELNKFDIVLKLDDDYTKLPENTLIDGEYITQSVTNNRIAVFAGFDVYFHNGNDIRTKSLKERLDLGNAVLTMFENSAPTMALNNKGGGLTVFMKDFEFASDKMDIHECCERVLRKKDTSEYLYNIDGIIFTPQDLAVNSNYKGQAINYTTMYGMTPWKRVFKWKPPLENTIDFLVKFHKEMISEGDPTVPVTLYVGYNPSFHDPVNVIGVLNDLNGKRKEENYEKDGSSDRYTKFEYAVSKFDVKNGNVVDEKQNPISDNSIVECRFDGEKWVPIRTRHDKTKLLKMTGSISSTANDYKVAQNVKRTIDFPVEKEDLLKSNPNKYSEEIFQQEFDDEYYNSNDDSQRNASLIIRMREFHNRKIKETILIKESAKRLTANTVNKKAGKGKAGSAEILSIYDIACGKGADILKWTRAGFTVGIGSDISRDNIVNPRDGVYARLKNSFKKQHIPRTNINAFMQMDVTRIWNKDYFQTLPEGSKELALSLWGLGGDEKIPSKFKSLLKDGAHVVSCQFAIHYFFEIKEKFSNFMTNLKSLVKIGGYFLITGLDGEHIQKLLAKDTTIYGKTTDNVVVWEISKLYDDENIKKSKYGNAIKVYVQSLGAKKVEYIVDFNELSSVMGENGFEIMNEWGSYSSFRSTGMFSDVKGFEELTPPEQEFSKLNRWSVFQRIK